MTSAVTTQPWRIIGRESGHADRDPVGSAAIRRCGPWCRAKLELEWSPEQIAAWLRQEYPERRLWHVCHETIYQAVYHGGNMG